MGLFPARFNGLDLAILILESFSCGFSLQYVREKGSFPILLRQAGAKIIGWPGYNSSYLRELGDGSGGILLVMTLRVQNISHFQELQITTKFGRQISSRQVEPLRAGIRFVCLVGCCQSMRIYGTASIARVSSFNQRNYIQISY